MKSKFSIAVIAFILMTSCVSCISIDDRGSIPNTNNPIRPPSLTNEWDVMTAPVTNGVERCQ